MPGVIEEEGPFDPGAVAGAASDAGAGTYDVLRQLRASGADAAVMAEARARIAADPVHGTSWALGWSRRPPRRDAGMDCVCGEELVGPAWQGSATVRCGECGARWHVTAGGFSTLGIELGGPSEEWLERARPLPPSDPDTAGAAGRLAGYLRPDPDLVAALAPVLADAAAAVPAAATVESWSYPGADRPMVVVRWAGGGGTVLSLVAGSPSADDVVAVADPVQEAVIEELCAAGRPAVWPACPDHPGTHPLGAVVVGGVATWCCPRSGRPVAPVGSLTTAHPRPVGG